MLSALDLTPARGRAFKRLIRSAAALNDLYDDVALGKAANVGRGAVAGWWRGSRPAAETIPDLAEATGLSAEELYGFLYDGGPPPSLPVPESRAEQAVREGAGEDRPLPPPSTPDTPPPTPQRRTRGSGAGRA